MVERLLRIGQSFAINSDPQRLTIHQALMLVPFPKVTLNSMLSWVRRSGETVLLPNGIPSCTMFIVNEVFFFIVLN